MVVRIDAGAGQQFALTPHDAVLLKKVPVALVLEKDNPCFFEPRAVKPQDDPLQHAGILN